MVLVLRKINEIFGKEEVAYKKNRKLFFNPLNCHVFKNEFIVDVECKPR